RPCIKSIAARPSSLTLSDSVTIPPVVASENSIRLTRGQQRQRQSVRRCVQSSCTSEWKRFERNRTAVGRRPCLRARRDVIRRRQQGGCHLGLSAARPRPCTGGGTVPLR